MFKIDLFTMSNLLCGLPGEELISTEDLNPYLVESVIQPVLQRKEVCYGDLDYDQFSDLDLQYAYDYYCALYRMRHSLSVLSTAIRDADACASRQHAFC